MNGLKLPGVWKTLVDAVNPVKGSSSNGQNYRMLWTGLGAQLARDVPFSAICWSILEPTRRSILSFMGEEPRAGYNRSKLHCWFCCWCGYWCCYLPT
ncbi:unnamed protein product [Brassica oleracea var. botrytis]